MKILAIEWGNACRSVAIGDSKEDHWVTLTGGRQDHIGPMARQALRALDWETAALDALAVAVGPGSYTGIRAAIAFAQGWSLPLQLPVIPVRSDRTVAWDHFQSQEGLPGSIQVAAYAQRDENAVSTFRWDGSRLDETQALRLEPVATTRERALAGADILGIDLESKAPELTPAAPKAAVIGQLAAREGSPRPPESLEPVYLREVSFKKAPETPEFLKGLLAE